MKQRKNKPSRQYLKQQNRAGYMFFMPWLIGFLVFTLFPFIYTVYLSFHKVNLNVLGWTTIFNGIDNYVTAFLRNPDFTPALIQFFLTELIYVPTILIISFILALLLNGKFRFRTVFRIIYFLPVIVISGSVMNQLMSSGNVQVGNVRRIFVYQIIESYSPQLADVIVFLFNNFALVLWFTGIPIVLFLSGLQKINTALYEAAQIDGATSWQILWKITMPIIRPIVLVAAVFTVVSLGMFPINPVYGMIQTAIFDTVGGLGVASSYAWIYSMTILLLIAMIYVVLKDHSKDEYVINIRQQQAERLLKQVKKDQRRSKLHGLLDKKAGEKHEKQ
ncbi:MAG: sugar ABC transporter permease [Firmicutes bacterium HGW-Firmicutes-20]|jgi:oligogalacturonide transport system permease protein|nr:MAG: sugar ABC transporter permease [Firmicutes bacterium HGW-Firmicutes-20]PKM68386.1 MAG: sugar ABC transporter permease [Firmicutes bacterium HGW-Firmicutes-19]